MTRLDSRLLPPRLVTILPITSNNDATWVSVNPLRARLLTATAQPSSGFCSARPDRVKLTMLRRRSASVAPAADETKLFQLIDHRGRRCGLDADTARQFDLGKPILAPELAQVLVLAEADVVPRQLLAQRLVEHRIAVAQLHAKPDIGNSADGGALRLFQLAKGGSQTAPSATPDRIELRS